MYVPKNHEEKDIAVMHALIKAHPLSTWVMQQDGELIANHIPFLLDASQGEYGLLRGHVARANDAWLASNLNSIVIFQGPEAYITPSWYPSKHQHGKAVPTWNYAVVHAQGVAHAIEDRAWLLRHVSELTATHEASQTLPWKVTDAPQDFIERMLGAIIGIEIPIVTLTGKWKVSQNRPEFDRLGVVAGLLARGDEQSRAMADLVSQSASRVAKD